jgi:hypothetical protein
VLLASRFVQMGYRFHHVVLKVFVPSPSLGRYHIVVVQSPNVGSKSDPNSDSIIKLGVSKLCSS